MNIKTKKSPKYIKAATTLAVLACLGSAVSLKRCLGVTEEQLFKLPMSRGTKLKSWLTLPAAFQVA